MTLLKLIEKQLNECGYSGLINENTECGCCDNDLSPGYCLSEYCYPGYKRVHSVTGEYIIIRKDIKFTDEQIESELIKIGS